MPTILNTEMRAVDDYSDSPESVRKRMLSNSKDLCVCIYIYNIRRVNFEMESFNFSIKCFSDVMSANVGRVVRVNE